MLRRIPARALAPLGVALAALAPAGAARAQTVLLDEGTFRLLAHGQEVGSETFSIRRSGSGANAGILASGRIVLDRPAGAEQVTASLEVRGPRLRPAAYQVLVEGPEPRRIAGRLAGGRFRARILSPVGEQLREYLAGDGAFLIDEGVAHHYYFLARLAGESGARVPILVPRQSRQVMAIVSFGEAETIRVGERDVAARRLVVEPADGPVLHVWVDAESRVLRLEVPADGWVAARTAAPR